MVLLYAYITALILGGILLGASLLLGGEMDADADLDVDADVDLDADADVDAGDADADAHAAAPGFGDVWLPFTSLRFWVFFLAFFGLTGTLLSVLGLADRWTILVAALVMGSGLGIGAASAIHKLKAQTVGEVAGERDYEGLEGTVLLPVTATHPGKVRLNVRGQAVDLPARTTEGELDIGTPVLVVEWQQGELDVVRSPQLES
jgi:hypothetical protein